MAEACAVCNNVEEYARNKNSVYICGVCVQVLLTTPQEQIIAAYHEAEADNDTKYQWAMRAFMYQKPSRVKLVRRV